MDVRLVGLTGGIATGKSTVARILAKQPGVVVIDADVVARQVLIPPSPILAALVDALGADILTQDGTLDRAALRQRISQEPDTRSVLNGITHPAIRDEMAHQTRRAIESGARMVVTEAALLVETGSYRMYPELWVVTCTLEQQLDRLMARDGMSDKAARALIATQLPLSDKEAVATTLIRNDGSVVALTDAVLAALSRP